MNKNCLICNKNCGDGIHKYVLRQNSYYNQKGRFKITDTGLNLLKKHGEDIINNRYIRKIK